MSRPNRFSKELTVRQIGNIKNKENPFPAHKFVGVNIIGKTPDLGDPDILAKRNEALAYMRSDERFSNINTIHPSKSPKFSEDKDRKFRSRNK